MPLSLMIPETPLGQLCTIRTSHGTEFAENIDLRMNVSTEVKLRLIIQYILHDRFTVPCASQYRGAMRLTLACEG